MPRRTHRRAADEDTKQLQRRMRVYYIRDGLWDLFVGLSTVMSGILIAADMPALIPVALVIAAALVLVMRPRITFPRAGYARFRSTSPARNSGAAVAAMVAAAAIVLMTFRTGLGTLIQTHLPVWLGLAIGGLVGLMGWSFGASRFIAYGAVILLAMVVHQWGGVAMWLSFTLAGIAITTCGLFVLYRFVRDNPRVDTNGIK